MPQSNSIANAQNLPSADLGNATAETLFKESGGTNVLTCWMPSSSKFKNKPFQLFVGGRCQSGTTSNFTAAVYFGNAASPASGQKIATSGAIAMASVKHNWQLAVNAQWDADSQKIQGSFSGQMANSAVALAALSNVQSTVDLTAADTDITASAAAGNKCFTVTGLFGSTNAANHAYVDFFEIQQD